MPESLASNVAGVPCGYRSVQPYLIVPDAEKAMEFYQQVFGATVRMCMRNDGRVAHAELVIGDSCIMLADENPSVPAYSAKHFGGSPIGMMLYVEDCDAIYHRALAAGATSEREPADQPYGERMAGVRDPAGLKWYLGTPLKQS